MAIGLVGETRVAPATAWREAAVALVFTVVIVVAGEAFGAAISEAAAHIWSDLNPVFTRVAAPVIVAGYQIALLWFVAGWWFGPERRQALGLYGTPVVWWVWPTAIVGLYALKAVVSIGVLYLAYGGGTVGSGSATEALTPFAALMRSSAWPLMLAGGVLAAIVEELLYRGYLSRTLETSRLGFWGGAATASVLWAALHVYYPLPMQIVLVAVGFGLSWLRAYTGSILPGMAWHIANNTIALVALRMMG